MTWIIGLWNVLSREIKFYLAIALAVLVAFISIRRGGVLAQQAKNQRATLKAIGKKNEIHNDVNRMPEPAAADQLREDWSRD